MAVRVDVSVDDSRLVRALILRRYDLTLLSLETLRRAFWRVVAGDIRSGDAPWPVDTGYSRGNFFQRNGRLYNHAPYVNYISGGRAVRRLQSWIDRTLNSAVDAAAEHSGLVKIGRTRTAQVEARQLRRAERELARVLTPAITYATRDRANVLFELGLRRTLTLAQRRRQRFYRLRGFRDFIFSDGRS